MIRSLLPLFALINAFGAIATASERPRVIVTSDAEIDDQCSMARFLLYANEWDIEGIITSSSQYRWQGYKWPGDDWIEPYLDAYEEVYPNLATHDPAYPTPAYLRSRAVMGNAKAEGDMAEPSPGSELIVKALLDRSDSRPIWLQAWGGANTIARALKSIEEEHPERMAEVASKCRLFLIWEQDETFQNYIRPVWGRHGILTIISDQFEAIAYRWKQTQPAAMRPYFEGAWMRANLLRDRGPLADLYHAHENGDFRAEGDTPAFLHTLPFGLRSMESPDWGGWGGRYVRVRENTWLDPVPVPGYAYPEGRWFAETAWGLNSLSPDSTSTPEQREGYFKPMWRWTPAMQNDFAARMAWSVHSYDEANHPPQVALAHSADLATKPGSVVALSAEGTADPDGDSLSYRWWHYEEASTHSGAIAISDADRAEASLQVPEDAQHGTTIHLICEVTDDGEPPLTRYQRVVVTIDNPLPGASFALNADGAAEIPESTARFPLDGGSEALVPEGVHSLDGELIDADPALAWVAGAVDGAVRLDGRAGRIVAPHHEAIDFGDESFSISFWMRWPKGLLPQSHRLLVKGDYDSNYPGESGRRYEILIEDDSLRFAIDDGERESQLQVDLDPFVTGEWVHLAAVRDRAAGRLRLYADGARLPTSAPGNPGADGTDRSGSPSNPRDLYLGAAPRLDLNFQGELDELRLFRGALSDQHVAALAARVLLVETAPSVEVEARDRGLAPSPLPPMTAHFPLTEGEGVAAVDRVAGVAGRLENVDPHTAWTSSERGLALNLDGVDDRIVVSDSPGFDFGAESFSVGFHMRWTRGAPPTQGQLLGKGVFEPMQAEGRGKSWEIKLAPTGLQFAVDDGVELARIEVPHTSLLGGHWRHIVATRATEEKRLKLFVDGRLQVATDPGNDRTNGADKTGDISNSGDLVIGDSSQGDNPLSAELADIRFYRSALTEPQAASVARLRRHASSNPAEQTTGNPPLDSAPKP